MGKVLTISNDIHLLHTRSLVLEQTGAEVYGARFDASLNLLETQFFDVVVLCHTLSERETLRICELAELIWPLTRLLFIGELGRHSLSASRLDAAFPWRLGPEALVSLVKSMLQEKTPLRGKRAMALPTPADTLPFLPVLAFRGGLKLPARAAGAARRALSLSPALPAPGHSGVLRLA